MVAQADGMDRIYHCAVGATIAVGTSAGHHALRIAQFYPVKTLVSAAHASATIAALVGLTNTPTRARDLKELKLLGHRKPPAYRYK